MSSADRPTEAVTVEFDVTGTQDQLEFEIAFYGHVLQRNANNVDVLRRQVELLARAGRYHAALPLHYRLVQLQPRDFIARYNLACVLSMLDELDEAIVVLDQALGLGYADVAHLESDADLEAIRGHDGYQLTLAKHGLKFVGS